jgi:phenylalanyl-tRNA synthetase beta chain
VIKNLNTLETPMILQRRLELSGIRPISLPVDITNYVMLELGQPLHVFDETALKAQTITVRHAREGEAFVSLDGQTRDLLASDCVISDGNTTLAIGGVMGGANSGVNETTHSVVLEAALFDPIATRRTANRLALRTESAIRFEKNVNPEGVLAAAQRAAYLFQTIAGGTVEGLPVVYKNNTSTVFTETQLPFHIEAINAILGTTYSESDAVALLERLGFKRVSDQVIVPSWRRHACTTGASLAEEIARIGGFDSIPSSLPVQHSIQDSRSDFDRLKQESETWLIQNGLLQAVTFPMISPEDIKTCLLNSNSLITITNPITADQSVMRPSLLPSLLKIASFNAARQAESLRYMDAGRTFQEINGMIKETECLAGLVSGARLEHTYCEPEKKSELFTFYSAKALLEGVLSIWNVQPEFRATYLPDYFHPKQGASLRFKETTIGYIGTVHPHITKAYGLPENTFYFEIYLSKLLQFPIQPKRFDSISKFPSTRRDIAFSTPKSLTYAAISAVISKYKPTLVRNWYMFDLFESEAIGADKKSIAFAFIYQNINETISDEAVNDAHRVFYQQLQDTLPITIR